MLNWLTDILQNYLIYYAGLQPIIDQNKHLIADQSNFQSTIDDQKKIIQNLQTQIKKIKELDQLNIHDLKQQIRQLQKKNQQLQNIIKELETQKHIPELNASEITNIVFEGGGIKGVVSHIHAITALQQHIDLSKLTGFAGTSAGAIIACCLAIGFTPEELVQTMENTDFSLFQDDEPGIFRDISNFYNYYGYCEGKYFFDWLGVMIAEKTGNPDYTLGELLKNQKKKLIVTATNLSKLTVEYLCPEYHPKLSIREAVRISMSVPFIYQPIKSEELDQDFCVDGGLCDNYPLRVFDGDYPGEIDATPNWSTLGIKLHTHEESKSDQIFTGSREIDSFRDYLSSMAETMMMTNQKLQLGEDYWPRTIIVPTHDIPTFDFHLSEEKQEILKNSATKAVNQFFNTKKD